MRSIVVICTRNRPEELGRALASVKQDRSSMDILVVDASDDAASRVVCEHAAYDLGPGITYERAPERGLARQRNFSLARLEGYDLVHYIDDDTEVEAGYFDAIEASFADPTVVGVGAVVQNQPPVRHVALKSFFMLYGFRPGKLLKSGRNTIGHYPSGPRCERKVDWLPGCAMSYRVSAVGALTFDARLEGYSWGEDFDFSNRLAARGGTLVVNPGARCMHAVSPVNRTAVGVLARQRTWLLHRWVKENRSRGFRLSAFWWSVLGEMLLRGLAAVRDGESRDVALGVARGAADILRRDRGRLEVPTR